MFSLFRLFLAAGIGLTALSSGFAQEKKVDAKAPLVRKLTISVGRTVRVQMTTKRPIEKVFNENEHIVRVTPMLNDPTTVLVTGLMPGVARIHLTDIDGKMEIVGPGKAKEKK